MQDRAQTIDDADILPDVVTYTTLLKVCVHDTFYILFKIILLELLWKWDK